MFREEERRRYLKEIDYLIDKKKKEFAFSSISNLRIF